MTRKQAWLAIGAAILSGSMAHAQGVPPGTGPYPANMGMPQPMSPFGAPFAAPAGPFGVYPGVVPGRPTSQPRYDGTGPKAGAAEPYLVPSEQSEGPAPKGKKLLTLPPADAGKSGPTLPPAEPTDVFEEPIGPPPEPYTVYEGPRSLAEVKQDDTRVWAQANVIHWWIRRDSTPPLVTSGNPGLSSGAFGAPDTALLLGNGSIGPSEFTGVQAVVGMWLDEERLLGIELGGFYLGKNSRQYSYASDANGNPPLSQPVIVAGKEQVLQVSTPGTPANPVDLAGRIGVNTIVSLYGTEVNFTRNYTRTCGFTFDYLFGVRYLYLNETLNIDQSITALPGANFQIPFMGVPQPAGSNFVLNDSFSATNRYIGGQVGARLNWAWRCLDIGALMKIGAGATFHEFDIGGTSTLNAINGTHTTVQGGTLAQASNIGSHNSTNFSVVPELTLTLGYQVTPCLRLTTGYTLLYWTHVMRVGNNIDRNLDPGQAPTLAFPTVTPGSQPHFPAIMTEFWAQGVNVGLEVKY